MTSCRFRVGLGGRFTARISDSDCGVTELVLIKSNIRLQHSRYVYCNPAGAAAYVQPVRRMNGGVVVSMVSLALCGMRSQPLSGQPAT